MPDDSGIVADDLLADSRMLRTLNTFISSQSCVLLLGPLFGVDQNNQKIHVNLRNYLTEPPNSLVLDDEFDNLYISKISNSNQNVYLINEIYSYYQTVQPSEVYEKILSLGFRAIITYTSDLLLANANTKNEYDFSFFSAKGNQPPVDQGQVYNSLKKPVIYNIFGNINDLNSLITDYDSLYDFLINILTADQEFPLQLKNILSNARAFLFLGFDLRKWYIPLIIRKFNQFILSGNRTRTAVSAFTCLDDTAGIQPDLLTESLSKYPLSFVSFNRLNSIELINELAKLPKRTPVPNPAGPKPLSEAEAAFFKKWSQELIVQGKEGLDIFFREYKNLNYSGAYKNEFDMQNVQYNDVCIQRNSFRLSEEDFGVASNNIIYSALQFINKLLNP